MLELDPNTTLSELPIDSFEVGQSLLTRHGRVGNAVIVDHDKVSKSYCLVTDFGNKIVLPYESLNNVFALEDCYIHVIDLKERFLRQSELLQGRFNEVQDNVINT